MPNELFGVLIWATIGGIFVLIGLFVEKVAEWMHERFLGGSYNPHKGLGEFGWVVLMFGIMIEIATAGSSALDEWQTKQMTIKDDPFNQPVSDVTAEVVLNVNRTYSSDLQGNGFQMGSEQNLDAVMIFCDTNLAYSGSDINVSFEGKAPTMLAARGYDREADTWGKGKGQPTYIEYTYTIKFFLPDFIKVASRQVGESDYKASDTFNDVKFLLIKLGFLPYKAEVREGTVDLVINGTIHKKMYIIPYKNPANAGMDNITNRFSCVFASDSPTNNVTPNIKFNP